MVLSRPSREATGNFYIDEDLLREAGVTDFTRYAVDPEVEPITDFFLD
jgi:citronellol/citronellal dehydrogenase